MKLEKEKEVCNLMIELYCHKKHKTKKGKLCAECKEMEEYVAYRLSKCPFGENKTFCSNCRIHCYNKEHREKIREIMRFSGPRMIFHHPILAFKHVIETKKEKKKLSRSEKS